MMERFHSRDQEPRKMTWLHGKRVQLQQDTNMAVVSLFWDINTAAESNLKLN